MQKLICLIRLLHIRRYEPIHVCLTSDQQAALQLFRSLAEIRPIWAYTCQGARDSHQSRCNSHTAV